MPLKTSSMNKKYFRYTFTKNLPMLLCMTLVMLLLSFCIYTFANFSADYGITALTAEIMSLSTYPFAFIYPIILSTTLFSFLHKKQGADFYGSVPVKRSEMFLSNTIIAAIAFLAMIVINGSFILAEFFVLRSDVAAVVVLPEILKYVFVNFVAFMLAYSVSAFAATLTGTGSAQVFLTYIIMIVPSALVSLFSSMNAVNMTEIFSAIDVYSVKSSDVSKIFVLPNIMSFPFTTLFCSLSDNDFLAFYGVFGFFTNAVSMIYNCVLTCAYTIGGLFVFKKYKFENAESPFCNKWTFFTAKILLFSAAFFVAIYPIFQSDGVLSIILTILVFVAYIVFDIILKKGIKNVVKSLGVCTLAIAGGLTLNLLLLGGNIISQDVNVLDPAEITSCTIYLPTVNGNIFPESVYGTKNTHVKIQTDDPEIINKAFAYSDNAKSTLSPRYFATVKLESGNSITKQFRFTGEAMELLCKMIAKDDALYNSLVPATKTNEILETFFGTARYEDRAPLKLGKNAVKSLVEQNNEEAAALSENDRMLILLKSYTNNSDAILVTESEKYSGDVTESYAAYTSSYQYSPLQEIFIQQTDDAFRCNVVSYHDGKYYRSEVDVPNDEQYYPLLEKTRFDKKKGHQMLTNYSRITYRGSLSISNLQPAYMTEHIKDIALFYPDIFCNMITKAISEPIIFEDTLYFSVNGFNGLIYLNTDRDIIPALEEYAERISQQKLYHDSISLLCDKDTLWNADVGLYDEFYVKASDDREISDIYIPYIEGKRIVIADKDKNEDRNAIKSYITKKYDINNIEFPMRICSIDDERSCFSIPFGDDCEGLTKIFDLCFEDVRAFAPQLRSADYISIFDDNEIVIKDDAVADFVSERAAMSAFGSFSTSNRMYQVNFRFKSDNIDNILTEEIWDGYSYYIPIPDDIVKRAIESSKSADTGA